MSSLAGGAESGPDDEQATWPDVRSMSNADAAEAYAKAGVPVVPVQPGTKNPGSYLGRGWPQRATTDLDTIRDWWRRWPDAGMAMHVGGAGLLVLDVDAPENVPEWLRGHLERAVFRRTTADPNNRRGHYIYRLHPGDRFGSSLGKLKPPKGKSWGEVRCYGGAIVLAPTAHPRAAEGGAYTSGSPEPIPLLPDEIAAKLSAAPDPAEYRTLTPVELDTNAEAFLDTYTDDREPYALAPILTYFDPAPGGRHESMWNAVCWALREAKAGRFPARHAVGELRTIWEAAIGGEYRDGDLDEFSRMVRDGVPVADEDSTEALWARAHRNRWPNPRQPQKVAQEVVARAKQDGRPIAYWRGDWFRWDAKCWCPTSEDQIRQQLYRQLEHANYEHVTKDATLEVAWNPDKAKLTNVIDALKAETLWADDIEDGTWLDGRTCRVLPFTNGLLRIDDQVLLRHTPDYFNTEYIHCAYEPDMKLVAGQKFLNDLTGDDPEAIEMLMEFVGTRLVGNDRFQKMLIMVGPSGSGKGTFDRLLSRMLGRKHAGLRMDDYKNNGFPTEPLLGKSLVTFSDQRVQLDMKRFTDLLLQVVGGDAISVRRPYDRRSVSVRLPLTFIMLSNEAPVLPDNAGAMVRRVLAIKTPNSFADNADYDLDDKLAAELPAFVDLALTAYRRLVKRRRFVQPESGREILTVIRENASYLANFIDECCDVGPDLMEPKANLYTRWKLWCQTNGHTATAANKFASDLYSLPLPGGQSITPTKRTVDGDRVPCVSGVALRHGSLEVKLRVVPGD